MKYNICIVDSERIGEWIHCETEDEFIAVCKKLNDADIDYVVNPNW